jgi:site-specific recombinase XerD
MKIFLISANDEDYKKNICRTSPIEETVTSLEGYPAKLKIYKIQASRFWQVRCFFRGRVHTKSLRTVNKKEALSLAKSFYEALVGKFYSEQFDLRYENSSAQQFEALVEKVILIEKDRVLRGDLSKTTSKSNANRLRQYWLPLLCGKSIENITHNDILQAIGVLTKKGISSVSIAQYLQSLRSVFKLAHAENIIKNIPAFPHIRKKSNARGGFAVNEYRQLVRAAKKLSELQDVKSVSHRSRAGGVYTKTESVPKEIAWLIVFMVNGFMRPSDVIHIQHQHVQIVRGEHLYLRLTLPETKRHKAQIVTLPPAVRVYERLLNYMQAQGMGKPEDYVFLPELKRRDVAGRMMAEHFNKVLVVTGLRLGQLGQTRTLYSLRHTAIMFRLLYGRGIDLLTLARTSVQMIEKFYAANLTAEMNIDLIQGRRG